jgi:hypothetical protein
MNCTLIFPNKLLEYCEKLLLVAVTGRSLSSKALMFSKNINKNLRNPKNVFLSPFSNPTA